MSGLRNRTSDEELARMKSGTPRSEVSGGKRYWYVGDYALRSLKECAKRLGVEVEVVLRAAETDQLGALIEKRTGSGRNAEKRNLTRIRNLYRKREIAAKQVPPW
jgi:hypothetical protein